MDPTGPAPFNALINIEAAATVKNFTVTGGVNPVIPFALGTVSGWRISNITYSPVTNVVNYFCFVTGSYGLIDSCNITGAAGNNELIFARGPSNSWQTPDSLGTGNSVYVEDCTFNGPGYVCDANSNARFVVRFCTITGAMKVDGHGFASNSPPRSVREMEVYNNIWTTSGAFVPIIEIRGGTGVLFNNQLTNLMGADGWFFLDDYGCLSLWPNFGNIYQTPYDYPLHDQIGVGKDPEVAHSDPVYVWRNLAAASNGAGTATVPWVLTWKQIPALAITQYQTDINNPSATFIMGPTSAPPGSFPTDVIQQDRDFFYDGTVTGSFNGSTGIGVGTTAQMNATTPTTVGVGFWVTDQGNWNTTQSGFSGELYVWNGSSWVWKYTPFTYPNPLRAPRAPSNLSISSP